MTRVPCANSGFLFAAACLALAALVGCGPAAPYSIVPVSGKVTYEDGTPIPADRVVVSFESLAPPVDAKTHPRAGRAEVQPDGTFDKVTTWKPNDGAIVGPHKIVILATDKKGDLTQDVPKQFTSKATTPLKVDVQSGSAPFEIKIPKPK